MDRDHRVERPHGSNGRHRVARQLLVHRQHHQPDDPCANNSRLPIHLQLDAFSSSIHVHLELCIDSVFSRQTATVVFAHRFGLSR